MVGVTADMAGVRCVRQVGEGQASDCGGCCYDSRRTDVARGDKLEVHRHSPSSNKQCAHPNVRGHAMPAVPATSATGCAMIKPVCPLHHHTSSRNGPCCNESMYIRINFPGPCTSHSCHKMVVRSSAVVIPCATLLARQSNARLGRTWGRHRRRRRHPRPPNAVGHAGGRRWGRATSCKPRRRHHSLQAGAAAPDGITRGSCGAERLAADHRSRGGHHCLKGEAGAAGGIRLSSPAAGDGARTFCAGQ